MISTEALPQAMRVFSRWQNFLDCYPRARYLVALVAGCVLALAFAPLEWRAAASLSLTIFFGLTLAATPRHAFRLGWVFGFGYFFVGLFFWVYNSVYQFGDAIAPVAALITAILVAILAIYPALVALVLVRWLLPLGLGVALFLAGPLWVVVEWIRSWFLAGFAWLQVGYTQVDTWLMGYIPVIGMYGTGVMLVWTSGLVLLILLRRQAQQVLAIGLLGLLWGGGYALQQVNWTETLGEPISVAMLQANIHQHQKFQRETLVPTFLQYEKMSLAAKADIIVWPETAVPTLYAKLQPALEPLAERLQHKASELVVGVFTYHRDTRRQYNSVKQVGGDGIEYNKRHLVPFGEYMPLRTILDFLNQYLSIPMADLSPGAQQQAPMVLAGQRVGVSICYENAYGYEILKSMPEAKWLLNVSNDAWFGDTFAPAQHLEIARTRALETGREMARATNTGISAHLSHRGEVLASSPQFTEATLTVNIQPRRGETPFVKLGESTIIMALVISLLMFLFAAQLSRKQRIS